MGRRSTVFPASAGRLHLSAYFGEDVREPYVSATEAALVSVSDGKAEALAAKITAKAEDTLAALDREMTIMKWPAEFRAIMRGAVAHAASLRAHGQDASSKEER